jgi:hypothetical protein
LVHSNNTFDFALFEWNEDIDAVDDDVMLKDEVVLYPSYTAEVPGITLTHDGRIEEDLAALNALYTPVAIAGVNGPQAIHAEEDKYEFSNDDDEGIMHTRDIPAPAQIGGTVIPIMLDDEINCAMFLIMLDEVINREQIYEVETIVYYSDEDNDNDNPNDADDADQDQGECRYPRRANRGVTLRYNYYALLAASLECHATI